MKDTNYATLVFLGIMTIPQLVIFIVILFTDPYTTKLTFSLTNWSVNITKMLAAPWYEWLLVFIIYYGLSFIGIAVEGCLIAMVIAP
jgi:hypothetical protein